TYAAAVPPPECGRLDENQFRNGEILTQPNEHPWIGKIDRQHFKCGAVLIDANHALTPAHCVENNRSEIKDIIFGDWNLSNKSAGITAEATQNIPVKKITLHPDFRLGGFFENDMAIIELEEKVVYTDFVQPICLPSVENHKPSENLTVVGFGYKGPSRFLQRLENGRIKVPFETRPKEECLEGVIRKHLQMEYTCGHTSRSPISGSALVEAVGNPKKFHLIGIAVGGFNNDHEARQIHVNILPRLDWILRNIGE
ncbi:hypothetical protein KR026_002415, partial [Drosophila bipectinata]